MSRLRIDRLCRQSGSMVDDAGRVVIARCHLADRPVARLVGLLATRDLSSDEGVLFRPCHAIHMFGMRSAIACAFLDGDGTVMRVVDPLQPGARASCRGARETIEASAGAFATLTVGTRLRFTARG